MDVCVKVYYRQNINFLWVPLLLPKANTRYGGVSGVWETDKSILKLWPPIRGILNTLIIPVGCFLDSKNVVRIATNRGPLYLNCLFYFFSLPLEQ